MESIEKLRESLKDCTRETGVEPNQFGTYWITARACDMLIDEIEAEIESRYMLLPVDADGVPIRIGDTVREMDDCVPMKVMSLTFYEDCVDVNACGMNPKLLFHVNPRTIEDILADFAKDVNASKFDFLSADGQQAYKKRLLAAINETADEIRELIKVNPDSCWFANFGNPERMAQTIIDTCCYDCKSCPFNSVELLLGKSIPCSAYYGCEQAQYGEILTWLKDGAR